jgi:hypothetical protein
MLTKKEEQLIKEILYLIKKNHLNVYLNGYLKCKGVKKDRIHDLILIAKQDLYETNPHVDELKHNCYMNQYVAVLNDTSVEQPLDVNNVAPNYMNWVNKQ